MEFWEKEYEKIITETKEAQKNKESSNLSESRKNYYNACWEEIEKPNGSKYYAPKKKKIHKEDRSQNIRKRPTFLSSVSNIIILVLRIYCDIIIFAVIGLGVIGILKALDQAYNPPVNQPSQAVVSSTGGATYVDGIGFNTMMDAITESKNFYHEILNVCATNSLLVENNEVVEWIGSLSEYEDKFNNLQYDDSYDELIDAHLQVLSLVKQLLQEIYIGETFEVKYETYASIIEISNSINDIMIDAFEKNGIYYQIIEGSIHYTYKMY